MQRFNDWARDPDTAAPAPLATVAVRLAGTDTLAPLFSDNAESPTPKVNPFTAATDTGIFAFYAANGRYDITVTPAPGEGDAYSLPDTLLFDPDGVA